MDMPRQQVPPPQAVAEGAIRVYRFGTFELDRESGEVRKSGLRIRIQEKPFQALLLLLDRAGEVVPREDLRRALWPEQEHGDFEHGVNLAITRLRSVLGDRANSPRFIETLARRGYRFIAPVEHFPSSAPGRSDPGTAGAREADDAELAAARARAARRWAPNVPGRKLAWGLAAVALSLLLLTVAFSRFRDGKGTSEDRVGLLVLPFHDLSPEPAEYLSQALTSEMIARLGRIAPERLAVYSFTTALRYQDSALGIDQIARELDARYVLEGSVTQADDMVRIHVRLIDARDQTLLLSRTHDSETSDILALERTVSAHIVASLTHEVLNLVAAQPIPEATPHPEVYEAFLRGRYFWNQRNPESLQRAVESFEEAIGLDAEYAPAHAGLADSLALFPSYGIAMPSETMPGAKAAALRALELDATLAEAHTTLAWIHWTYEWDFEAAAERFRKATRLNANYATAHQWHAGLLLTLGRFDEALVEMERALELDPLSLIINTGVAWVSFYARRYDRAIEQCRRTLELEDDFGFAQVLMARSFAAQGANEEAIFWLRKRLQSGEMAALRAELAYVLALAGDRRGATSILDSFAETELDAYVPPYQVALARIALDDRDGAFRWLEAAYRGRSVEMTRIEVDPRLDPLRGDPRFEDLTRRVGLR